MGEGAGVVTVEEDLHLQNGELLSAVSCLAILKDLRSRHCLVCWPGSRVVGAGRTGRRTRGLAPSLASLTELADVSRSHRGVTS